MKMTTLTSLLLGSLAMVSSPALSQEMGLRQEQVEEQVREERAIAELERKERAHEVREEQRLRERELAIIEELEASARREGGAYPFGLRGGNDDAPRFPGDSMVREHFPPLMKQLEERYHGLREESEDPYEDRRKREEFNEFYDHVRELGREMLELRDAPEELLHLFVKEHEVQFQIEEVEKRFHAAESDAERRSAEKELRELLELSFGVSQQFREYEAQQIEKELAAIHELLQYRQQNREQIIERRLKEITLGYDPYEW